MTFLLALAVVVVGVVVAVKILKFTVKLALFSGVAALMYLVVLPHLQRLL